MSEETGLLLQNTEVQPYDDSIFNEIEETGFLGRVQLCISSSDLCKQGKVSMNNYAYINADDIVELGQSIDVIPFSVRPCAIDTNDDEIIICNDMNSPMFKEIQEKSKGSNSGCFWGPEFLVWVPQLRKFCTFLMASVSARNESRNLRALLPIKNEETNALHFYGATLGSKYINPKKSKHSWYSPRITQCTTPLDYPDKEIAQRELNKFLNPEPKAELATESEENVSSDRE